MQAHPHLKIILQWIVNDVSLVAVSNLRPGGLTKDICNRLPQIIHSVKYRLEPV